MAVRRVLLTPTEFFATKSDATGEAFLRRLNKVVDGGPDYFPSHPFQRRSLEIYLSGSRDFGGVADGRGTRTSESHHRRLPTGRCNSVSFTSTTSTTVSDSSPACSGEPVLGDAFDTIQSCGAANSGGSCGVTLLATASAQRAS